MPKNRLPNTEEDCAVRRDGLEAVRAKELECLKTIGWYAHYVHPDPDSPTRFNAHTHGLDLKGLLDFQIVCPLPFDTAHNILTTLADRSMAGEKFEAGQDVEKVIRVYPVRLALAEECGRKLWRVIFPDKYGVFGAEALGLYPKQYEGVLPVG